MKKYLLTLGLLMATSTGVWASGDAQMDAFVSDLMGRMTLQEKIGQLNLIVCPDFVSGQISDNSSAIHKQLKNGELGGLFGFRGAEYINRLQHEAVEGSRLGIPLIFGYDVVHGMDVTFPLPLALSAVWNPDMAREMAQLSARESAADGVCWTYAPMVDICRDPRWGRIAEGAGEDPYLGSVLAEAYVEGFQGDGDLTKDDNIMACVKHYAFYGASEAGRDYNTVDMSRQRAFNEYLPPYKAAAEAGAGSFMTSFNEFEGIPCHANKYLVQDVLRDLWGFDGFVVSDYQGISEMVNHGIGDSTEVALRALDAGVDMDMMAMLYATRLEEALAEGRISQRQIDTAVRRVLEAKYKLGLFQDPYKYCNPAKAQAVLGDAATIAAARRMARACPVLLKNDGSLLPLKKGGKIAVVGPLADDGYHMLGSWSGNSKLEAVQPVSLYQGIKDVVGHKAQVVTAPGSWLVADSLLEYNLNHQFVGSLGAGLPRDVHQRPLQEMIDEAVAVSGDADVIIAALGENLNMNGEGSSRANPDIPAPQKQLLDALIATGKPVILVTFAGRPLILTDVIDKVPAAMHAWFLGVQAGPALADLLFGDAAPSGRLSATFPRSLGQIPLAYNHKNTGRPVEDEHAPYVRFKSNYLDEVNAPLFPFGYGLTYTTFAYGEPRLSAQQLREGEKVTATVDVTNTGNAAATETVQLYIRDDAASSTRPVKELKGFKQITLEPGQTQTVEFEITPQMLGFYRHDLQWVVEPGSFTLYIGHDSQNENKIGLVYI